MRGNKARSDTTNEPRDSEKDLPEDVEDREVEEMEVEIFA